MIKVLIKIIPLCFMLSISFSTVKTGLSSLQRSPRRKLFSNPKYIYEPQGQYEAAHYRRDQSDIYYSRNMQSTCVQLEKEMSFRMYFLGPEDAQGWFQQFVDKNFLKEKAVIKEMDKLYNTFGIDIKNETIVLPSNDRNSLRAAMNQLKTMESTNQLTWFYIFMEELPVYYDDMILIRDTTYAKDSPVLLSNVINQLKQLNISLNFLVPKRVFNDHMVLSAKLTGAPYHSVYLIEEDTDPTFFIMDSIKGHLAQSRQDQEGTAGFFDIISRMQIGPIFQSTFFEKKKLALTAVMRGRPTEVFYPYEVEFASCAHFIGPLSAMLQLKYSASVVFVNEQGVYLTRSSEDINSICKRIMEDMLQPNKQYTSMWSYDSIKNAHARNVAQGQELIYIFLLHEPEFNGPESLHQDIQQWFTTDSNMKSHFIWISRTINKDRLPGIAAVRDTTPIELSAGSGYAVLDVYETFNHVIKILRRPFMRQIRWSTYAENDKKFDFDSLHFVFPHNPSAFMSTFIVQLLKDNMKVPTHHLNINKGNQKRIFLGFGLYPSVQYIRDMKIDATSCLIHGPSALIFNGRWRGRINKMDQFFMFNGPPADAVWMGVTNCLDEIKGYKKIFILFSEGLPTSEGVDTFHETFAEMQTKLKENGAKLLIVVPQPVLAEWERHVYTQRYMDEFQEIIRVKTFYSDESMNSLLIGANRLWNNKDVKRCLPTK